MMRWYYQIRGGHTHVRVFMDGCKCGGLMFRNEEFEQIKLRTGGPLGHHAIEFIPDNTGDEPPHCSDCSPDFVCWSGPEKCRKHP